MAFPTRFGARPFHVVAAVLVCPALVALVALLASCGSGGGGIPGQDTEQRCEARLSRFENGDTQWGEQNRREYWTMCTLCGGPEDVDCGEEIFDGSGPLRCQCK